MSKLTDSELFLLIIAIELPPSFSPCNPVRRLSARFESAWPSVSESKSAAEPENSYS